MLRGRIDFVVSPEGCQNQLAGYEEFYLLARHLAGAAEALIARKQQRRARGGP